MRNCSDNDIDPSLNMKRWGGGGGVGLGSMRKSECLATQDTGCEIIRRIHSTETDEQPGGTGIEFLTS